MPAYHKHVYWLDEPGYAAAEKELTERGTPPRVAKKAVCVPLSPRMSAGVVLADAWDRYDLCARQLTWQAVSDKAGLTLVVTADPLSGFEPHAVIDERRDFSAPRLPDREQLLALIDRPSWKNNRPDEWELVAKGETRRHEQWLRVMGLRGVSFEELFVSHRANHANFLEPEYYVERDGEKAPYSIGPTAKVCSACLEFFGIVGDEHRRRLVVPCPGAAIFAGMAPNRYYEVTRGGQGS